MVCQATQGLGQLHQLLRLLCRNTGLVAHNDRLNFCNGVVQTQTDKALAGAGLEPLEQVLVAWVVGNHQHEFGRCSQLLASALNWQNAPVIGQRVQYHGSVFACLDHFVQVANGTLAHGACQGAIGPLRAAVTNQKTPYQVCRAEVIVA